MRSEGWIGELTQRYVRTAHGGFFKDLFGFVDYVFIHPQHQATLAVQVTSGPHVAARLAKIRSIPAAQVWLSSPCRQLEIHGWVLRCPKTNPHWDCRRLIVTPEMLCA